MIDTPAGSVELQDSYLGDDASRRLYDELDFQRASQAYIWAMPLVSMVTWRDNEAAAYGVEKDTDFVVLEFAEGEARHRDRQPDDALHLQLRQPRRRPAADRLSGRQDRGWFVYFRLYAPEQAFFDKSFTLPDFEMID